MTGPDLFFDIESAQKAKDSYTDKSMKDLLEAKFRDIPEKIFLLTENVTYTWKEIYYAVQIIAFDLYKLGVRKGTHVGICSTNSINWVLAFFAVQKLGGVACLLNFSYTAPEFYRVLNRGDVTHFVYGDIPSVAAEEEGFLKSLSDHTQVRNIYSIQSSVDFKSRLQEYRDIEGLFSDKMSPDDASVMIYTSGSSGRPKGILLSTFHIFSSAEAMIKTEKLTNRDRLCMITPLFHSLGLVLGLIESALGDCTVFFPKDIHTDTILSAIDEYKCTTIISAPTMVTAIISNPAFHSNKVNTIKTCLLAGAPATEVQLVRMQKAFPHTVFFNGYGLSELGHVSVTGRDTPIEQLAHSCGKPADNITVRICNITTGGICAPGADGEIIVKRSGGAVCYYKTDPSDSIIDDEGFLHTGDIGNMDSEGQLHITGRLKELIIRGGENIVPKEITEPITKYHGVQDVKVVGVPHSFYGEVPCACIVMKSGFVFDEVKMREYLASVLTKQKLPEYFYIFDRFPMLASGKTDTVLMKKLAEERFKQ